MLRFYAEKYARLVDNMRTLSFLLYKLTELNPKSYTSKSAHISKQLEEMLEICQELSLKVTGKHIERMLAELNTGLKTPTDHIGREINELLNRIHDELEGVVFMRLTVAEAALWDKKTNQFGDEVADKFPKLAFDIEEAARCLAVGRYTASVFHCMRIMELAVQYLGKRLGIKLVTEKNWHNILDEVDKAIKSLPVSSGKQKKTRNRFAEASAHLRAVKDAWRNEVMHPHERYTEDETKRIFANVKDFMMYLAVEL